MASALYSTFKELLLQGGINLTTGSINVFLIDTGTYTYDTTHSTLSQLTTGARIGSAQTLASITTTGGVFDGADLTFTAVTGTSVEAVVIYKDYADEASSRLIAYIEGSVTPNGGDITIQWDSGASKIFAL